MAPPLSAWGAAWPGPPVLDVEAGAAHLRSHVELAGAGLIAAHHDLLAYQGRAHIGQHWGGEGAGFVAPVKVIDGEGVVRVLEYPIYVRKHIIELRVLLRAVGFGTVTIAHADAAGVGAFGSSVAFVVAGVVPAYFFGAFPIVPLTADGLSHLFVDMEADPGAQVDLEALSVVDYDLAAGTLP